MANAATLRSSVPMATPWGNKIVHTYFITIDSVDEDLTIRDPAAGNYIFLVGMTFSEDGAPDITFKDGASTTITKLELAANQGILEKIHRDAFLLSTGTKGNALIMQSSAAIAQGMTISVIEAPFF